MTYPSPAHASHAPRAWNPRRMYRNSIVCRIACITAHRGQQTMTAKYCCYPTLGTKKKKIALSGLPCSFSLSFFFLLNFQLRYFCVVRRRKAMLDVASWLTASSSLATHMASTWSNAYTRRNKEREFPLPKNNSSRKGLWEGQSV